MRRPVSARPPSRFADVLRVVDLTHPVAAGMPVPVGFPPVGLRPFLSRADGDVATVEILETSLHAGTHVDAPAHMLDDAPTIDEIDPLSLCGPAVVVDVPTPGTWMAIEDSHLRAVEDRADERIRRGDAVLLRTGHGRAWSDAEAYMTAGWPYLATSAIDLLLDRGVRAVGVECADPDRVDQRDLGAATFECHRRLLGAGVHIIENLARLDELPSGRVELLALPLSIRGGSGAPLRVLALVAS
jgi:kynurenine formamidase